MNNRYFNPNRGKTSGEPLDQSLLEANRLREAGVDPAPLVTAQFIDGDGFEMGGEIRKHLNATALLQAARKQDYRPPPVADDLAINWGSHPDKGFPIQSDINEVGHIAIIGPTKKGKNTTARVIARDALRLEKQFHVIAQKGDELNEVNLTPDSIYIPHQLDPWNDLTPIGSDRVAYWSTLAEAIAIPKAILPQTQPEIALILDQMWRSAPDASWADFRRALRWKSEQPDGREKHATLAGIVAAYAVWLGSRSRVRRGRDIRKLFRHIIRGFIGASLDNIEVALGLDLARELFEAKLRGHSRKPRLFIFIPEAQMLYDRSLEFARRGTFGFLPRGLAMASSMGNYYILAFQSASRASDFAMANISTFAVLCQDSYSEALFCARLLGLGDGAVADLMSLEQGVVYIKTPGWKAPVKARIDHILLGPPLTVDDMETRFANKYRSFRTMAEYASEDEAAEVINWAELTSNNSQSSESERQAGKKSKPAPEMLEEHYKFACDIRDRINDGLRAHYDRLAWSIERGNRILGDLKAAGYVTVHPEKKATSQSGRPRLIATLTPAGNEFLNCYATRK